FAPSLEIEGFKAVNEAFGKDNRLAIVGFCIADGDSARPEPARQAIEKNGISWPQGYIDAKPSRGITNDYGLRQFPSVWLIGPDGKLIARDLKGDAIKAAVAKALGN